MSVSTSYLSSLYSNISSSQSPLLQALYGQTSGAQAGQAAIQAFTQDQQNQTKDIALNSTHPTIQQAISAFTKGVQSATSVKQLLANPAVMNVLLTANGMTDQIGYTGLATAALTSNLSDPKSLANTLTDTRWKTAATAYNFATTGLKTIQDPKTIAAITAAYKQTVWEQAQEKANPGVANALAFAQQAASIKSVDALLGNLTVRTVVTTALGIPTQIAFQSLNAQQNAISSKLDVQKLQDPKFVQNLVQQYLINNAANNAANGASTTPDLTTLAVQAGGILV